MKGLGIAARLSLLVLLPGGATHHLWTEGRIAGFHGPAPQNRFELYEMPARHDFLAVYDELRNSGRVRPRAYFVLENQHRTDLAKRPRFIDPANARNGLLVPIFAQNVPNPPRQHPYAVVNHNTFELHGSGSYLGAYDLPVYKDGVSTAEQIAITPFAVTLDVTLVGSVAFLYLAAHGFFPCAR